MQIQPITNNRQPQFGMALQITGNALNSIVKYGRGDEFRTALPEIVKKSKITDIRIWTDLFNPKEIFISAFPLSKKGNSSNLKLTYYSIINHYGVKKIDINSSAPLKFDELAEEAVEDFNKSKRAKRLVAKEEAKARKTALQNQKNDILKDVGALKYLRD